MQVENVYKPEYKWPVLVERTINTSAKKLWDVISMPGNLEFCHPFCKTNPVEIWPGEGSHDLIEYLNGWVFERRFFNWYEGIGYDLEIGRRGGRNSEVSWRIRKIDSNQSILTICIYPYIVQNLPVAIRWIPHLFRVRPSLRSYLDSVTKGFEWFINRNEKVPRNQFGKHPWFS